MSIKVGQIVSCYWAKDWHEARVLRVGKRMEGAAETLTVEIINNPFFRNTKADVTLWYITGQKEPEQLTFDFT